MFFEVLFPKKLRKYDDLSYFSQFLKLLRFRILRPTCPFLFTGDLITLDTRNSKNTKKKEITWKQDES